MEAQLPEQVVTMAFPHMPTAKWIYQKAPGWSTFSQEGTQNYFCNFLASLVGLETSSIELDVRCLHLVGSA